MCKKGKIVAFFANAFLNVYYMMDLFFLNTRMSLRERSRA
jgi:hypothetical protein